MAKTKNKCATPRCRGLVTICKFCHRCRAKQWKESSPFAYYYNAHRNNARRRKKEFTLTIEEFTEFAITKGLMTQDGQKRNNMSIDRIDPQHGYHAWNIQVLTIGQNTRKRFVDHYKNQAENLDQEEIEKWQVYEKRLQDEIDARNSQIQPEDDLPF